MVTSESDEKPPPRKRSRTAAKTEDQSIKRSRGRPRVDAQDATAADRRRTQIRLAQRAYRQRKETTISALNQENARLQSIVEQMNKSFLRFNGTALKSGLLQTNPSLAQSLKDTIGTFAKLAKTAAHVSKTNVEDETVKHVDDELVGWEEAPSYTTAATEAKTATRKSTMPQRTNPAWSYSTVVENSISSDQDAASPNRPAYSGTLQTGNRKEQPDHVSETVRGKHSSSEAAIKLHTVPTDPVNGHVNLPFGFADVQPHNAGSFQTPPQNLENERSASDITPSSTQLSTPPQLPSLSTRTFAPDWSYSDRETTFARRLHRSTLEAGFYLLCNVNFRPAALDYIFRLSLPYMSLEELRERFRMQLRRPSEVDLDFWETPFVHVGGAGTHYPRENARGEITTIPTPWSVRSIGPLPSKKYHAENSIDPSRSHELEIDLAGFEGEWFDTHDVQGYLQQEKGCHINAHDSFIEVFVDMDDNDTSSSYSSSLPYSNNPALDLDLAVRRETRIGSQSTSPGISTGTSSADSMSTTSTSMRSFATNVPYTHGEPYDLRASYQNYGQAVPMTSFSTPTFNQLLDLEMPPAYDQNNDGGYPASTAAFYDDRTAAHRHALSMPQNMSAMGADTELPLVKTKRQRPAFVDVAKLIDELRSYAVCLGRSPGYRRERVDAAFKAALVFT